MDKKGKVSDIKVMCSMESASDKEVLKVLSSMPTWTPGKMNGRLIEQKITIPIRIHLDI